MVNVIADYRARRCAVCDSRSDWFNEHCDIATNDRAMLLYHGSRFDVSRIVLDMTSGKVASGEGIHIHVYSMYVHTFYMRSSRKFLSSSTLPPSSPQPIH